MTSALMRAPTTNNGTNINEPSMGESTRTSGGTRHAATTDTRRMLMSTTETSIDVNVPVSTAYNQWTQFESFPEFMEGVEQVQQLDDTHLHWKAEVGGHETEWDAVITEQIPDERVAWRNTTGKTNAGVVTFHR